jgi:hypothetical protein
MNTGTGATDSVNFVGNEVTNTGFSMGNFSLAGTGHLQQGNTIKGTLTPASSTVPEQSLYLSSAPAFWLGTLPWPHIGTPYPYNQSTNTAQARYPVLAQRTDCRTNPVYVSVHQVESAEKFRVYPNPSNSLVTFECSASKYVVIHVTDIVGRRVAELSIKAGSTKAVWDASPVRPGVYLYSMSVDGVATQVGKLLITE